MIGFFLLHVITIYVKENNGGRGRWFGRTSGPSPRVHFISILFCCVLLCGIISNAVSSVCASWAMGHVRMEAFSLGAPSDSSLAAPLSYIRWYSPCMRFVILSSLLFFFPFSLVIHLGDSLSSKGGGGFYPTRLLLLRLPIYIGYVHRHRDWRVRLVTRYRERTFSCIQRERHFSLGPDTRKQKEIKKENARNTVVTAAVGCLISYSWKR